MKVRITYTADLEDVPSLVDDMLKTMATNLEQCRAKLRFNPVNFEKMVLDLQSVRDRLSVIDSQIDDVVNMTSGYLEAVATPDLPLAPDPEDAKSDDRKND